MTDTFPRLLGDVGGTNARFGWQANAHSSIEHVLVLPCAAHETLEAAIRTYLELKSLPMPRAGALGIANPITGDMIQMTNHHWSFSISEMQHNLGLPRLNVINDFTALALALPSIAKDNLVQVGGTAAQAYAPKALIGAVNDGFPPAMLAVAKLVGPRMRKGAVIVSDNVGAFWADHRDYLAWLRSPGSGFETSLIALNEGTEISVKS